MENQASKLLRVGLIPVLSGNHRLDRAGRRLHERRMVVLTRGLVLALCAAVGIGFPFSTSAAFLLERQHVTTQQQAFVSNGNVHLVGASAGRSRKKTAALLSRWQVRRPGPRRTAFSFCPGWFLSAALGDGEEEEVGGAETPSAYVSTEVR